MLPKDLDEKVWCFHRARPIRDVQSHLPCGHPRAHFQALSQHFRFSAPQFPFLRGISSLTFVS
eukprot:gene26314-biopygen15771